ncbi:hypothetical protein [Mycolicibacterium mengxianglii]|uniref:hypothetical protein n=1 Tax=Mycolicibacterium mengxianglii TaxID=2736649 RepID=UPI0018D12B73|nr:hypothetical protein [Mycolicibacterium mengxianglii]
MLANPDGPSVVATCRHCSNETVWLRTVHGGWLLFDAEMQPTEDTVDGNRYAVDRRSRLVVDLDCVLADRWPARCLSLHKLSCPQSYDATRFYDRRPRQGNDIDLTDLWRRLAAAEANNAKTGT